MVAKGNLVKKIVLLLAVFLLFTGCITSIQTLYPKVTKEDINAINYLNSLKVRGKILADPTFSEKIFVLTPLKEKLLTALNFEGTSSNNLLNQSLEYLGNPSMEKEQEFLKKSGLEFIVLNFEDKEVRGIEKFEEKDYLNKIYSLNYSNDCIFDKNMFYGFVCGELETIIYQRNDFKQFLQ